MPPKILPKNSQIGANPQNTNQNQQNQTKEIDRFWEEAKGLSVKTTDDLDKRLGLILPPKVLEFSQKSEEEKAKDLNKQDLQAQLTLWLEYFALLRNGFLEDVIEKEDIREFLTIFWEVPNMQKRQFLNKFSQEQDELLMEKKEGEEYWEMSLRKEELEKYDKDLEKIAQQLEPNLRPLFYYIQYTLSSNAPVPEEFWQTLDQLTVEVKDEDVKEQILGSVQKYQGKKGLSMGRLSKTVSMDELKDRFFNDEEKANLPRKSSFSEEETFPMSQNKPVVASNPGPNQSNQINEETNPAVPASRNRSFEDLLNNKKKE